MLENLKAMGWQARFVALLAALCLCLPIAGWTAEGQPVAPGTTAAPVEPAPAPAGTPAQSAVDAQYLIGPGDTIQVFVWRSPELTVTVPVRPDGKVSTPLVEDITAVGKTSSELAREVEKVLAEYIRSPQVNIIVTNPVSTFNQVKIIGEVTNPQSIAYRDGLTALDAILAVGGLTQFAAGNRAKISRKGANGKPEEIRVKLEALVRKGKIAENVDLRPGDVLVVPQSMF
jgi:polysaccharide export outer membrane protein